MGTFAQFGAIEALAILIGIVLIVWIEPATPGGIAILILVPLLILNVMFAIVKWLRSR